MKSISKIISAVSLAAVMTVQSAAGVFADTLSNDVIYNSDGIISMDEVAIDESVSDENVSVDENEINPVYFEGGRLIDNIEIEIRVDEELDKLMENDKQNTDSAVIAELKDTSYFDYKYTNDFFYKQLDPQFKELYNKIYSRCDYYLKHDYDIKLHADNIYYICCGL